MVFPMVLGLQMADPLLLLPERDVLRQIAVSRSGSAPAPPALVQLLSSFATPFVVCLAMELVEGASFRLMFDSFSPRFQV